MAHGASKESVKGVIEKVPDIEMEVSYADFERKKRLCLREKIECSTEILQKKQRISSRYFDTKTTACIFCP